MKITITTAAELEDAIEQLQRKAALQKEALGTQFNVMVESLKPANLLKSAVHNMAEKPGLVNTALGTTVAMGAGALSKKLIMGKSGGLIKKLLGGVAEFAISRAVANNFGFIADKGIKALKKMSR
jgi:hypothetical protein